MIRTALSGKRLCNAALMFGLIFLVAGCGSGGGGASSTPSGSSSIPSTPTNLTVSGTAASGLAIAGATVSAKCQLGTGTATTIADGTYSMVVADGQLPCVLQITNPLDGSKLHTVATGSGSTAIANITPLTEMLTARVLRIDPGVFFATFDPAVARSTITTATVKAAQTDVGTILSGTVDTNSLGDFIATPLKAATAGNVTGGDAQDKMLDALRAKLNNAQLTQVVTALANTPSTADIELVVANLAAVPPIANAGVVQSVIAGSTVTLDGSASSADVGRTLTYAWTLTSKPTGSSATLVSPTSAKPTFVADVAGTYVATVIVNDGKTNSSAAPVTVTASVANAAPVANAGVAQNAVAGDTVTLNGSASSDANGDTMTYAWTLTAKPTGSSATMASSTSAKPTFVADIAGTYVASLVVNDGKVDSAVGTVTVLTSVAPTAVGGILNTDTTWSIDKSPYKITSDVQIAYGATLSIDPGVVLIGNNKGITVYGNLNAVGTSTSKITFNDAFIVPGSNQPSQPYFINIQYSILNKGSLYYATGNAIYGKLYLKDSVLNSIPYIYLWYPVAISYIERNIFKNSGGISVGIDSRTTPISVYITNNVFVSSTTSYAVENWASYGGQTTIVSKNSFLDAGKVALQLPGGGYTSSAMTATNNYWGTIIQSEIQSMIYDKTNDLSSADYIAFTPFLTQPDPATPIYP